MSDLPYGKMDSDLALCDAIEKELEAILTKYGDQMRVRGANVFFAYEKIQQAQRYLLKEYLMIQHLQTLMKKKSEK